MTLGEITNIIQNKKYSSANELEALFHSIKGHFIIPSVTMAEGNPLYRATRITDINEVTNIQRLSYKPAHLIKYMAGPASPAKRCFMGV